MRNLIILITSLVLIQACGDLKKNKLTENIINTEIPKVDPENFGIDSLSLETLTRFVKQQEYTNIHSVLIAKEGKLIYEEYFEGRDYNFGEDLGLKRHNDSTLHNITSISKSVVSALIGIAIDRGLIEGVNQKVSVYFPEYDSLFEGRNSNWTIYHLLTMNTGLESTFQNFTNI